MSASKSRNGSSREPEKFNQQMTENLNCVLVSLDAVGDTTIRPMRSEVLRQVRPTRASRQAGAKKSKNSRRRKKES